MVMIQTPGFASRNRGSLYAGQGVSAKDANANYSAQIGAGQGHAGHRVVQHQHLLAADAALTEEVAQGDHKVVILTLGEQRRGYRGRWDQRSYLVQLRA